ncbi:sigma-70 family RNA polymerase sigma factor [Lysobacter maris]|uniref:Sigma-70 family RNA polymerase sigma factor n=1 Tax=Marilutibacter maris TaxID=1605891 RepID=A0A508AJ76_9GAMM|nr:sigma-70 family RNA polymerase sigma factor [Lysobacter maris]KAB8180184.1 sigma-70 family RNA polymerase sigma factor [Lysobacter maris]
MDSDAANDITRLLQRHHEGDRDAFDRMVPLVYQRLRVIARGQLARAGRRGQTLDTTALVQEAYLQLVDAEGVDWQDRGHFFAICARAMRRILVDYARRRQAAKRGGGAVAVTLEADMVAADSQSEQVLAIDEALNGLDAFNPRLARVVECRYFAGMTEEETARALDTSLRTVQRDWMRARAWLLKALA